MMSGRSICPVCKNPQRDDSRGTITQWMLSCMCEQKVHSQSQSIQLSLCRTCGKRIGKGRDGSITQYIFFHDTCQCEKPAPFKNTVTVNRGDLVKHYYYEDGSEDEQELNLNPMRFPVDRFKPLAELGSGASGTVWLARDRSLNKRVAVKVLCLTDYKSMVDLQREARAVGRLKHSNIVEIKDFGLINSAVPYLVLEYIPGVSLSCVLQRDNKIAWRTALSIACQICSALAYAHANGIFHRDIQPANILIVEPLDSEPIAKLIDFGIAKFGVDPGDYAQTLAGTPLYMSPDTGLGRPYGASSEVYSVGCVLFEMITGTAPFSAESPLEILAMHASADIPAISAQVPEQLEALIATALAKDPGDRFESASAMCAALKELLVGEDDKSNELTPSAADVVAPLRIFVNPLVFVAILIGLVCAGFVAIIGLSGESGSEGHAPRIQKPAPVELSAPVDEPYMDPSFGKNWQVKEKRLTLLNVCDEDLKNVYFWDSQKRMTAECELKLKRQSEENFKLGKGEKFWVPSDVNELELISMGSSLSGVGVKHLIGHDFSRMDFDCQLFGDETASLLPRFPLLNCVGISRATRLSERGLGYLVKLPNLSAIRLRFMELPTNTCKIIASSKSIRSVNLGHSSGLELDDFTHLAANPKINVLRVAATDVGDNWMDEIVRMKLYELDINETLVTDIGLQRLGKIATLKAIAVSYDRGITQEGVRRLQKQLPNCVIREK